VRRREAAQLAGVLLVGLVVRAVLVDWVGIWVDHGFYAYDSRLILEGKRPFVDFLGRSPLWLHLYAAVRSVVGYSPTSLRAFIILGWLVTALPVYGLAREIGDHTAALVTVGVFWLLPYSLVYGMWANTMSVAAAFGVTAVYLAVIRDRARWWAVIGVLAAAAFLSRRSAVVILAALTLFACVRAYDGGRDWRRLSGQLAALSAAWVGTLLAAYWLVVGGGLGQTVALAETHAVNLILTTGRGGWPLLGANVPNPGNTVESGRIPILNDLCQLCGAWTARTLAKGLLVTAPAAAIATGGGLRYLADRWLDPRAVPHLFGALAALGLFAIVAAARTGHWLRLGTVAALAGGAVVAHRADLPTPTVRDRPALLATLLAGGGMAAGYLYRERLLHVYYGMDVWPYLSVLVGVVLVALWRRSDRPGRALLTAIVVVACVSSLGAAYPLTSVVTGNDAGWQTTETLPAQQQAVDARTEPGEVVLARSAIALGGTDARMPLDDSRATAHFYSVFQDSGPVDSQLYPNLTRGMQDGSVALVIEDALVRRLIADNATATRLYQARYCRVSDAETQAAFSATNATLYRYQPDCPAARAPSINVSAA
jgi:hypothetical protein